jgi:hypothetical protein
MSPIGFTRWSGFRPTLQDQQGCGIVKRMATQTVPLKVPFLRLNAAKAAEFTRLQDLNLGPHMEGRKEGTTRRPLRR